MDIKSLKKAIETNTLSDDPLILKYTDNNFLCSQYINAIAENKRLGKIYITSLSDIDIDALDYDLSNLYIYNIDKLEENVTDDYKNLIVVCKAVPTELDVDYTEIPKLQNWQIQDYFKAKVPGLDVEMIQWLCENAKYDIFRLDNEIRKLSIFSEGMQKIVFNELSDGNGYADINSMNIFNFTEAIIKKDLNLVRILLPELVTCDLEPLGVVTILLNKFLQTVNLQNPNATAQSLGMSDKQFYYLRSHPLTTYTQEQLIRNIEFLTSIDSRIKNGEIDISREQQLAYYVSNVLA